MRVWAAVEADGVGVVEHGGVVVGRQPAQHEVVAAVELLTAQLHVAGDRAGEGLVDREEAEELLRRGVEQIRLLDELPAEVVVLAEVEEREGRQ